MAEQASSTFPARWSLADAIDLPIALEEERLAPASAEELAQARAEIEREVPARAGGQPRDGALLRAWIHRWRRAARGATPGIHVEEVLRNAGTLALFSGALLGFASASDRLFFTGHEPLNVFALIGVFVFLPLALSALLLLTSALRPPGRGNLLQQFFLFLARKITRHAASPDDADPLRPGASWASLSRALGQQSVLLQAPVLAITQKLALGFGIGLLLMLQLRVSFWELAFGWQTTLAAPGEWWHALTRIIAAPWSWFWADGAPTIEQINATRFSRLEGATPIDPAASRGWWPFLAATILVWSVMLRAGVLLLLRSVQARRLRAYAPQTADALLLLRRLSPSWTSKGPVASAAVEMEGMGASVPVVDGREWMALIADEPDAAMPQLRDLPELVGVQPQKAVPFRFDDSLSEITTAAIGEVKAVAAPVLVMVPASRDPIDEVNDTLRAIRASAPAVTLILRGSPQRLGVWRRKLDAWDLDVNPRYISAA